MTLPAQAGRRDRRRSADSRPDLPAENCPADGALRVRVRDRAMGGKGFLQPEAIHGDGGDRQRHGTARRIVDQAGMELGSLGADRFVILAGKRGDEAVKLAIFVRCNQLALFEYPQPVGGGYLFGVGGRGGTQGAAHQHAVQIPHGQREDAGLTQLSRSCAGSDMSHSFVKGRRNTGLPGCRARCYCSLAMIGMINFSASHDSPGDAKTV